MQVADPESLPLVDGLLRPESAFVCDLKPLEEGSGTCRICGAALRCVTMWILFVVK